MQSFCMPELPFCACEFGHRRSATVGRLFGPPKEATKLDPPAGLAVEPPRPKSRYEVNRNVSPLESERWMVTIGVAGMVMPLFNLVICGAFHIVIDPL